MDKDLLEDLKEKNSVARSARASVVGGKKKYMFQSDYLSKSEKKKLNGEITVYKMNEPISWKEFRSYPRDMQVKYLEMLRDEFGASMSSFKRVTGATDGSLYPYFAERNLKDILLKYPEMSKKDALEAWLRSGSGVVEETKPKEKKSTVVPPAMFYNVISSCEMNLSGKASEISQMLFNIFQNQKIIVSVVLDSEQDADDNAEEVDKDCSI